MTEQLHVIRNDESLLVASYGVMCIAIWNQKPTLPLFEEQRAALAASAARHPGRTLFLCVVSDNTDPPDSPVRDASVKMLRDHAKDLIGCACVIEGSGFRAAITRSVLTGMVLVARAPVPLAFFQNTSDAVDWLRSRTDQTITDLARQLGALRKGSTIEPS